MATQYKSTLGFRCWKQHECVGCGTRYRYRFERKKEATASSEAAASKAVREQVDKALELEVDPHPCPRCAVYQPEMVALLHGKPYGCLFALGLVAPIVLGIVGAAGGMSLGAAAWSSAGAAVLALWSHLSSQKLRPNGDLDANVTTAEGAVAGDVVRMDEPGKTAEPSVVPDVEGPLLVQRLLFRAVVVAVAAIPLGEALRLGSGWPSNPGFRPPVAGPGDRTLVQVPHEIQSLKGHWRGKATARVTNAAEIGAPETLDAESKQDSWAGTIHAKSSEKNTSNTLWAYVRIPDNADLAGKRLELRVEVVAEFPVVNDRKYDIQQSKGELTTALVLAPPGAGTAYSLASWAGLLGGGGFFLIGSLVLASLARRVAGTRSATRCFPIEEEKPPLDSPAPQARSG